MIAVAGLLKIMQKELKSIQLDLLCLPLLSECCPKLLIVTSLLSTVNVMVGVKNIYTFCFWKFLLNSDGVVFYFFEYTGHDTDIMTDIELTAAVR